MDCSPLGSSMGFPKQEYQSGLPFPSLGDLPNPGIEPGSSALQTDSLLSKPLVGPLFNQQWCIGCWGHKGNTSCCRLKDNTWVVLIFFFPPMKRHRILHAYFPMVQHIWAEFCTEEESNGGRYYYVHQGGGKKTILFQNSVRTSGLVVSMSFGNNALDHSLSL